MIKNFKYQCGKCRKMVDSVRASLVVFKEKMEVLGVSGTLKGLRK